MKGFCRNYFAMIEYSILKIGIQTKYCEAINAVLKIKKT